MICQHCEKEFEPMHGRMKFCSHHCRYASRWEAQRIAKAAENKSANIKPTKWEGRDKTTFITDAEQRRPDKEIFLKTAVRLESRCYKPGDPEWDALVKSVTPIEKVPAKRHHYHRVKFW